MRIHQVSPSHPTTLIIDSLTDYLPRQQLRSLAAGTENNLMRCLKRKYAFQSLWIHFLHREYYVAWSSKHFDLSQTYAHFIFHFVFIIALKYSSTLPLLVNHIHFPECLPLNLKNEFPFAILYQYFSLFECYPIPEFTYLSKHETKHVLSSASSMTCSFQYICAIN